MKKENIKIYVVVDNIRSALNVGSILRTSDAFTVNKVYLCGITPTPDNKKVLKTSLGAEKSVKWEYCENTLDLVEKLKKKNIEIISLEKTEKSMMIEDFENKGDICLILGNEVSGVSEEVLKKSDKELHIDMRGKKESLNVSVAYGIALFSLSS